MMAFVIANTYLSIIAAAQDAENGYDASGSANAIVSVIAFGKYFVCRLK